MKLLLFLICCSFSTSLFSQQLHPEVQKYIRKSEPAPVTDQMLGNKRMHQNVKSGAVIKLRPATDTLPKTHRLPEDILEVLKNYSSSHVPLSFYSRSRPLFLNPQQPGVYALPLDRMPCIVPETKDLAVLPNIWKGKVGVPFNSQMPNSAQPYVGR